MTAAPSALERTSAVTEETAAENNLATPVSPAAPQPSMPFTRPKGRANWAFTLRSLSGLAVDPAYALDHFLALLGRAAIRYKGVYTCGGKILLGADGECLTITGRAPLPAIRWMSKQCPFLRYLPPQT